MREQVAAPRSVRLPYQSDGPVRGDELTLTHRPFSYAFYVAPANLRTTIALGITTVRDAGGADLGLKRAVEDGVIPGPRMQIAVTMLSQTGGHNDPWLPSDGTSVEWGVRYPGFPMVGATGSTAFGPRCARSSARVRT